MKIKPLSDALRPYSFRGKARLLHSLCPRTGEHESEIFGYRIRLDLSDYIQRSIYLGTFEPYESCLLSDYLKAGMTFVDVGANVGYYTLMAAFLVGRCGHVFAFEPSPYAFGRLTETIKLNNVPQIRTSRSALSNVSGEMRLFMPRKPGNHSPSMVPNAGGCPINVPVRRLDDCLEEYAIKSVDLMKIDVEGFEPNVIEGTKKYIERGKIRAILCEFNAYWLEQNGSSPNLLYESLASFGYKSRAKDLNPKLMVQNLLFTLN